jgi:hypothetical protein
MQATGMVNDHLIQCYRYRQAGASTSKKASRIGTERGVGLKRNL